MYMVIVMNRRLFCNTVLVQSQTFIKRAEKKFKFAQIIHFNDLEAFSSVVSSVTGISLPGQNMLEIRNT